MIAQGEMTQAHGRFKSYPEYRDSAVEWLGRIPAHWTAQRMKWTVAGCQNGVWGNEPDGPNDLACIRVADFDRVAFRVRVEDPTLRSIEPHVSSARLLETGDLLIEKSGGGEKQLVGAVVLFDHNIRAVCSNFVARMPVRSGHDPRFLSYLHATAYAAHLNLRSIKQNTGIQNLDSDAYLNERSCIPPLAEQRAIAAFLDRETEKIDALIAKKERLIELLKEKRTALITHAVTKGLDPNVKMKVSGVEWLGEIPKHWKPMRLRNVLAGIEQGWSPECESRLTTDDEWGVLKTGCVNGGVFDALEHKALPAGIQPEKDLEVHDGDVLMSRASGSPQLIGSVAYVSNCRSRLMISDKIFRLHPIEDEISRSYIPLVMGARPVRAQIEQAISGAGGLANNIGQRTMKDFWVPVPPLKEQHRLADTLLTKIGKLDETMNAVRVARHDLKELRTALISAAVTGKIDVREGTT